MNDKTIDLSYLNDRELALFRKLTKAPAYAWPTLMMAGAEIGLLASMYVLGGLGVVPLWLGMVLNMIAAYLSFSVIHDAIHRAISQNQKLNDWIGKISLALVLPYVDMRLFRWAHSKHHRFANDERDPDNVLHLGPAWALPLRWMFIDLIYAVHAIRHGDRISGPFLRSSLLRLALFIVAATALSVYGYGVEFLLLWFIPSRFGLMCLGFVFFWLPHVPHDVSQEENYTRATTVRLGHEKLLSPILQYQNFHLIHHLYPLTPFYNNAKVYWLIEKGLRKKDLAIQQGFKLLPEIHYASGEVR